MNNRHFRAPLNFDRQKFERGYKATATFNIPPLLIHTLLKGLYVFFLLAIDLILFTGSGNLNIFHGGWFFSAELWIILGFAALVSFLAVTIFSFSKWLQNGICALATFWFIIVLFNQFSQFDNETFLGNFFASYAGDWVPQFFYRDSAVIFAAVLAVLMMWFLFKAGTIALSIMVLLFLIALTGILRHDYCSTREQHDFVEIYQSQLKNNEKEHDKKFIYLMLPNLASYKYFSSLEGQAAEDTLKIVTGFLAQNKFEVYPNAYNENDNPFMNMVQAVNTFSSDSPQQHIMDTIMLYKYWKFFNVNDEYVFLKDNQMFDTFRKAGYKISAYKSRGFDLCHKNHMFNVDRCMEKLNHPINLYSMDVSNLERAQLLMIEWFTSMKLFKNMSSIYQAMQIFGKPETLPLVGVNYNNLYVVNSIKTFEVLAENILDDKGRQAYFVYADIPSDMFVYDEFCQIKPRDEWTSMEDLPWVNVDNTYLKQTAYFQQTKCLYGKLQELINKLEHANIMKNTVIIINGMSATNNFQAQPYEDFINNMAYGRVAMLAIKSPLNKKIVINNDICSSNGILRRYLYKQSDCSGLADINIHYTLKDELKTKLRQFSVSPQKINANKKVFNQWYQQWGRINNITLEDKADILKQQPTRPKRHIWPVNLHKSRTPELQNETLQFQTKE